MKYRYNEQMYRYNLECIDTKGPVSIPCIDTIQTEATAKPRIDTIRNVSIQFEMYRYKKACIDTFMQKCKFFIPWTPETLHLSPGWPTPMPLVPKKIFRRPHGGRRSSSPLLSLLTKFIPDKIRCLQLPLFGRCWVSGTGQRQIDTYFVRDEVAAPWMLLW